MSKNHYVIPIFVPHEGCPHQCVFCNQNIITGSLTKVDSDFVNNTVSEYLETMDHKNSVIEVSFYGGTFTAIPISKQNELLEVALKYKKENKIDFIRLSTRPDYIDDMILQNLKNHSVDIIELGVQSMDNEVLLKSGRGHTKEDVVEASILIKKYGFTLGHQIMPGLPGDNFEKDIITAQESIKLRPDLCRIYPSLVIKNTPMEQMYLNGTYKPYTLEETVNICKILYCLYSTRGINIIRIGLQPTEEINFNRDVVAGPFHPAIRELIEGSLYNDIIAEKIPENYTGRIEIYLNNKDISKIYANKKSFFNDMKNKLKTSNIEIIQDMSIDRGCILLKIEDKTINLSLKNYIENMYKEGNYDIP